jgi:hypothetical protein
LSALVHFLYFFLLITKNNIITLPQSISRKLEDEMKVSKFLKFEDAISI